jgi:predicted acylesterase/phospholipase RssA
VDRTTEVPSIDERAEREARSAFADLSDPASYAHRPLICDLVMKGGITSGVVYPLAISELATAYRFRNIGGTSAGAISAAAAAAAEHRGGPQGFIDLAKLPARLGGELQALFRPQRACRRVFRVLLLSTKKAKGLPNTLGKLASVAAALLAFLTTLGGLFVLAIAGVPAVLLALGLWAKIEDHWPWGLALFALLFLLLVAGTRFIRAKKAGQGGGAAIAAAVAMLAVASMVWMSTTSGRDRWSVTGWFLFATLSLVVAVLVAVVREAFRVIPANDFGLVGGSSYDTEPRLVEPLAEWLHSLIQGLAGKPAGAPPLTFGELARLGPDGRPGDDGVNLTILTTCLSRGRIYYLPYDFDAEDPGDRFWFAPDELRRSLPADVIDYLRDLPRQGTWIEDALYPLIPLPRAKDLPVVMAVRMSLSFPALISSVRLRSVDWTLMRNREARLAWREYVERRKTDPDAQRPTAAPEAEPCWFSDGGIISNFPVHLFDQYLPDHPTFAINLRGFHPDRVLYDDPLQPEHLKIYRPATNSGGMAENWTRWQGGGITGLSGFVHSIFDTIQNWSDNDQSRVPGYRDRIVHVSHGSKEGGINLAMPPELITALAERGRASAIELKSAFSTAAPPSNIDTGWRNHKWVRLRSSLALLSDALQSIVGAYDRADPVQVESYRDIVHRAKGQEPSYKATTEQRTAMIELIEGVADATGTPVGGVIAAAARLESASKPLGYGAPGPAPILRITPGHRTQPRARS